MACGQFTTPGRKWTTEDLLVEVKNAIEDFYNILKEEKVRKEDTNA